MIKWKMPENRVISRNEARENLAAIISNVQRTGKDVWIGLSEDKALSSIISIEHYEKEKNDAFRDGLSAEDVEIQELRKKWAHFRSIVEASGKSRRILKRGAPVAVLVPTGRAYDRHISAVRDEMEVDIRKKVTLEVHQEEFFEITQKSQEEIRKIKKELSSLRKEISLYREALQSFCELLPEREDIEKLNKLLSKVQAVLVSEWRKEQGLPVVPQS